MIITILSLIITIACLAVIVSIVGKRWNALSAIDTESLPAERDARTKQKILSERLTRHMRRVKAQLGSKAQPLFALVREHTARLKESLFEALDTLHRQRHKPLSMETERAPVSVRIDRDLEEAARLRDNERFEESEKHYIDIIAKDAKNTEAYEGLSQIYIRQKEWASAQEVLEFLCSHMKEHIKKEADDAAKKATLEMRLAESLKQLATTTMQQGKNHEAEQYMQEALELQPQNPKFLDGALEMYMMVGKKREARAAFSRLRDANPDNQKLEELEERIDNL